MCRKVSEKTEREFCDCRANVRGRMCFLRTKMLKIRPLLTIALLVFALSCAEASVADSEEVSPNLPLGLGDQSTAWIHARRQEWSDWSRSAEEGDPVGVYLDSLRSAIESPSTARSSMVRAAGSGLSEGRFSYGIWLIGQNNTADRAEGVALVREVASKGVPAAQWEMAKMYRDGDLLPQDLNEEARYSALALEGGCMEAAERVAQLCVEGKLDAEDFLEQLEPLVETNFFAKVAVGECKIVSSDATERTSGIAMLESAAAAGLARALTRLGVALMSVSDSPETRPKVIELLEKAHAAGDDSATELLCALYADSATTADDAIWRGKFLKVLEGSSARGHAISQFRLGRSILRLERDRALKLFDSAFSGGVKSARPEAQRIRFLNGDKSVLEAIVAAAAVDPYSALILAELSDEGLINSSFESMRQNAMFAYQALKLSRAAYLIGRSYDVSEGQSKNLVEAMRWYTIAASNDLDSSTKALVRLREAYATGIGVTRDAQRAAEISVLIDSSGKWLNE